MDSGGDNGTGTARHEFRSDSSAKDLIFIFLANGDGMERISILLDL